MSPKLLMQRYLLDNLRVKLVLMSVFVPVHPRKLL